MRASVKVMWNMVDKSENIWLDAVNVNRSYFYLNFTKITTPYADDIKQC